MALATFNPIRLCDAHLMCTGEFLITPPAVPSGSGLQKSLGWLTDLPSDLDSCDSLLRETEVVTSLVLASDGERVRTGLVLRLRMTDDHATPQQCQAAREGRMDGWQRTLAEAGLEPVRPLGAEGLYAALLPRERLTFLRRATAPDGAPLLRTDTAPLTYTHLEELVAAHPGSGLCITLFPGGQREEMDFLIATWGMPEEPHSFLNRMHLPLTVCPEADPADLMTGFQFLYDPWALLARIRQQAPHPALTATTPRELAQLFGPCLRPAPTQEEIPATTPMTMARAMLEGVSGMRQQMHAATRAFTQDMKEQVTQAVQPQLGQVMRQVSAIPGAQAESFAQALARLRRLADSMTPPELAAEAHTAGLDAPIDTLTLYNMGFGSEQELLDAGLTPDLLTLLRSTLNLRRQCPECGQEDTNCIPYAFMTGYMYEALLNRFFAPLFRVTKGNPHASFLSDYTRVDEAHMQRLTDYAARDRTLRALTPRDWAAWMTLCNMIRSLRNRQHSGQAAGFISHDEMAASHDAFFVRGQGAKVALTHLPAFSAAPPAWSREFKPALPASWGATPDAQRTAVARHIASRVSAFAPSLLQFLLRCGSIAPKEGDAC